MAKQKEGAPHMPPGCCAEVAGVQNWAGRAAAAPSPQKATLNTRGWIVQAGWQAGILLEEKGLRGRLGRPGGGLRTGHETGEVQC